MVYIGSIGLGIPPNNMPQNEVKQLIQSIFEAKTRKMNRLLPVFNNAKVNQRQFVVSDQWIKEDHTFAEANEHYFTFAKKLSLQAIDRCLQGENTLHQTIPYEAIDLIVFVSSTGIVTPSLDAYLINERPFREDVIRMPLWGLGCAGGAMGLSRAAEWIRLHPTKNALIVCCELCSLTFQKEDMSTSNIVGTALFGDGVAATLLIGSESKYKHYLPTQKLKLGNTSSYTQKNSTNVMGWNVTANGLEVIFSKRIPKLVNTIWKKHVEAFLKEMNQSIQNLSIILAHPGGRKVLEEMESALTIDKKLLSYSYDVLANHGNMSSSTIIYVLKKWLEERVNKSFSEKKGILSALGPGFSSELLFVEWVRE